MSLSSLFVVCNALRLTRFQKKRQESETSETLAVPENTEIDKKQTNKENIMTKTLTIDG